MEDTNTQEGTPNDPESQPAARLADAYDRDKGAWLADELDLRTPALRSICIDNVTRMLAEVRAEERGRDAITQQQLAEQQAEIGGWNSAIEAVVEGLPFELDRSGWDGEDAETLAEMITEQATAEGLLRIIDRLCPVCAAHVLRPAHDDCPAAAIWDELRRLERDGEGEDGE